MPLLNDEWRALLKDYREHHDDPICEATHLAGIPMIMASLPAMIIRPVGLAEPLFGKRA